MMNMRRMESLSESKESTAMGEMVLKKLSISCLSVRFQISGVLGLYYYCNRDGLAVFGTFRAQNCP